MGVEGALSASGEVSDPATTVPRAILGSLSVVTALFIGLQVVAQGILGAALPNEPAPLVAAAGVGFGRWAAQLIVATTGLCVAGFLASDMLCSPRIFCAMADRRQLPRVMATVHPTRKTPVAAIAFYTTICAVVAASGSFTQLAMAAASGTLVVI
jgi:amino acid transporter